MPKIAFSNTFTVGNVIQIVLIVLGGLGMWFTLVAAVAKNNDAIAVLQPAVSSLQTDSATFNTRLTVVESRAETQSKALDKLSESVDQISNSVQSLNVTTATTKTDVGYIRDYVEEQKRVAAARP